MTSLKFERIPELPTGAEAVVMFDGKCNFCSGSMLFAAERTQERGISFLAMQTPLGRDWLKQMGLPPGFMESFLLVTRDEVFSQSEGIIRLGRLMGGPWRRLAGLGRCIPERIRDLGYRGLARNRYRIMGQRDKCFVPEQRLRERFLTKTPAKSEAT